MCQETFTAVTLHTPPQNKFLPNYICFGLCYLMQFQLDPGGFSLSALSGSHSRAGNQVDLDEVHRSSAGQTLAAHPWSPHCPSVLPTCTLQEQNSYSRGNPQPSRMCDTERLQGKKARILPIVKSLFQFLKKIEEK